MEVCYKAKILVDKVYMDSRHGPPGQFSQQDSVTGGWPNQRSGSETRIDKILIEDVCVCVCILSLLWRLSYIHTPGHLKGLDLLWFPWECLEALTVVRPSCDVR